VQVRIHARQIALTDQSCSTRIRPDARGSDHEWFKHESTTCVGVDRSSVNARRLTPTASSQRNAAGRAAALQPWADLAARIGKLVPALGRVDARLAERKKSHMASLIWESAVRSP
jgi:hypothetical protein